MHHSSNLVSLQCFTCGCTAPATKRLCRGWAAPESSGDLLLGISLRSSQACFAMHSPGEDCVLALPVRIAHQLIHQKHIHTQSKHCIFCSLKIAVYWSLLYGILLDCRELGPYGHHVSICMYNCLANPQHPYNSGLLQLHKPFPSSGIHGAQGEHRSSANL